ncbi:MAG TPA: tetratricopeptide repeat protein [Pseudohongiella sp.]|nr:tetratricopeptide repeat protein [Pseudohongiella sp.]
MMLQRLTVVLLLALLGACASGPGMQAPVSTSSPSASRGTVLPRPTPPEEQAPAATSSPAYIPQPVRIEPPQPPVSRPPVPDYTPLPAPERQPDPATPASALLSSVDEAMAAGDLERAAAISERALRISPRDPWLWFRLASIRYQQRQYSEAEGFARRALSFAGSDRELATQINQLLGQIP